LFARNGAAASELLPDSSLTSSFLPVRAKNVAFRVPFAVSYPRMRVTQVAICPSEASKKAGRPALTPELLAASGARYSRNNEGLQSILSKIDPNDLEKSVDSIFRMVDYGHQSIADMVPVAMFIDGVSIWLAYHLWTLCPTAGGQESSTRYLKISPEGLVAPDTLGIEDPGDWSSLMQRCFSAYTAATTLWEEVAAANPALMGIPRALLEDPSEAARKKVARLKRNYAFDRARYFLPVAASTNVMLLMSARGWVHLCQSLLSHPLREPRKLGETVLKELELTAPRLTRHGRFTESTRQSIEREFAKLVEIARGKPAAWEQAAANLEAACEPFLEVLQPEGATGDSLADDLLCHSNRYAPIGSGLQRTAVRFGWSAVALAEIRDLNRHRTGTKYCPLVPRGFYWAADQLPPGETSEERRRRLRELAEVGRTASARAIELLRQENPAYIYWSVLGTQYLFEHNTTADKFIYEAELRTGLGAHFRYAKHLRDVLSLWYAKFPATRPFILEGTAEPE